MITEEEYDIFIRYATSLLFEGSDTNPRDIVHDVVLKGIVEGHSVRYMMFNIRMGVLGRNRGKKQTTDKMPNRVESPTIDKKLELDEVLTALGNVRIYKRGGDKSKKRTVDIKKTNAAKAIVKMSYEGYSEQEISKVVGMDIVSLRGLKYKTMKRVKEQLKCRVV